MTRTTLKALWFGGGGILATWLAVAPNQGGPASSQPSYDRRPTSDSAASAEHLNNQADRLRERTAAVTLNASTRNPFRFSSRQSAGASSLTRDQDVQALAPPPPVELAPPPPPFTLTGVAKKGGRRMAVIASASQIYLVGEGDTFAGRFTVVSVQSETALIRDDSGAELRLVLP
jgi:hypothetical protein